MRRQDLTTRPRWLNRNLLLVTATVALVASGCQCGGGTTASGPCNKASECGAGAGCYAGVCAAANPDGGPNEDAQGNPIWTYPDAGTCSGLACQQVKNCPVATKTRVTGVVNTPAGNLPLPNVTVYVPNTTVQALPAGVQCDRCGSLISGNPVAQTTTNARGEFTLEDVPVGSSIPLVIQTGKWRRQISLPTVQACGELALTDAAVTRLPKNKSEGDMPLIALSTGGADALECLLRKIGIDDTEFSTENGSGRVHLYAGTGGTDQFVSGLAFSNATTLWNSLDNLKKYDAVFLSCEGNQNLSTKSTTARGYMKSYADIGGKVFASHWHNAWIQHGPTPWPSAATFISQPDLNAITADIDLQTTTGNSLADWLMYVNGSTTRGKIDITAAQHTVAAVGSGTERLIYKNPTGNASYPNSEQYFSFFTPKDAQPENQCGKVVFTDIHVASGDTSKDTLSFPTGGCTSTTLSPQEKALIFMFFDITACIQPAIN